MYVWTSELEFLPRLAKIVILYISAGHHIWCRQACWACGVPLVNWNSVVANGPEWGLMTLWGCCCYCWTHIESYDGSGRVIVAFQKGEWYSEGERLVRIAGQRYYQGIRFEELASIDRNPMVVWVSRNTAITGWQGSCHDTRGNSIEGRCSNGCVRAILIIIITDQSEN